MDKNTATRSYTFWERLIGCHNEDVYRVFFLFGFKIRIRSKVLILRKKTGELTEANKAAHRACGQLQIRAKELKATADQQQKAITDLEKQLAELQNALQVLQRFSNAERENIAANQKEVHNLKQALEKTCGVYDTSLSKIRETLKNQEIARQKLDKKQRDDTASLSAEIRQLQQKATGCETRLTKAEESLAAGSKRMDWMKNDYNQRMAAIKRETTSKIYKYSDAEKLPLALADWYFETTGNILNLKTPSTYNEKIQWMKAYDTTPVKTQLADKYQVREVEIAVIADNGFMVPSIVMLTSAKLNKKATSRYKIHFVCVKVSGYFKKKLLELSSPDFKVEIHNADTERYSEVRISSHVTSSTILKLDLTTILPEVDKVLHLDGDALVFGDLGELFQTDIDQYPLGVVRALSLEHNNIIYKRTGRAKRAFNAGVMLINLKRWREMNASEELHSMLDSIPREWVCLEQDCMNVFFHDNAKYLPLKYNVIPYVFQNRKLTMQQINEFYGTSYRNHAEMCDDAVILHLAGTPRRRPWEVINGVHGNVWQYYYDRSPLRHHYLARKVFNENYCSDKVP